LELCQRGSSRLSALLFPGNVPSKFEEKLKEKYYYSHCKQFANSFSVALDKICFFTIFGFLMGSLAQISSPVLEIASECATYSSLILKQYR
jgi:hypothetical protein